LDITLILLFTIVAKGIILSLSIIEYLWTQNGHTVP